MEWQSSKRRFRSPDPMSKPEILGLIDEATQSSAVFQEALTHRSVSLKNYERLEFLGDSVLSLVIADYLFNHNPFVNEGDLSKLRAHLVRKESLASVAREFGVGEIVKLGQGEIRSGGHRRETILADTLEAILGAIYLIKGLEFTKELILRLFEKRLLNLPTLENLRDAKSRLQEYLQARNLPLPEYRLVETSGEPHKQHFQMECLIESYNIRVVGEGNSKRKAEQESARKALVVINGLNPAHT